jgi:hypothetical protein
MAAAFLLACLPACGAILGIEEGTLEDAGGGAEAGADGATGRDAGHAHDAGSTDGHDGSAACNMAPVPLGDAGSIVYVSANGSASLPCGKKATPCLTVQDGVATATALVAQGGAAVVWVGQGAYSESVTLASGVSIRGGFATDWTVPRCGAPTVITGVTGATLTATNLKTPITVSTMTLHGTSSPAPGESVYGVFATSDGDAGAGLTLEDVTIALGPAGNGTPGLTGTDGAGADASCSTSGNPFVGEPGSGASNSGTFSIDGFTPSSASKGSQGGTGLTGSVGAAGCAQPCIEGCTDGLCSAQAENPVCAAVGPGGCGGGGGGGGTGGGGGGSSVALFAWNVPVLVQGGALGAGNGGPGGMGGPGGPGGAAPAPTSASCVSACTYSGLTCVTSSNATATSTNGAPGGQGGTGGRGGGGAGGSSYSLYSGGSSTTSFSGAVAYSHGKAGLGTPAGIAAQEGSP